MAFISLSGAVLAGGQGTRMGGQDKGLLLFQNEPMALSVARVLSEVSDSVFVNANRHVEQYSALGYEVISDVQTYYGKGPLSGLLSCLIHANSSHLLIAPCDTPCVSDTAFKQLKEASQKCPNDIHYLSSVSGDHPLHAILPVQTAKLALKSFLDKAERYSVMAFYEQFGCQKVLWEREGELLNVNTADSLR
jgi:molybdopterin-guanine dinucleotide biosynthesis protein A